MGAAASYSWVLLLVFSGGTGISAGLVVAFAVTLVFFQTNRINYIKLCCCFSNKQDKLQLLWWRLGHGSAKAVF